MSKSGSNPLRLLSHMLAAVFNSRAAFKKEWERSASASSYDPVPRRWSGAWISEQSGHRGQLKCVLSPNGPDRYCAHFYASYSKFFKVGYATDLKVQTREPVLKLEGEQDLGALAGGVYRCLGEIKGDRFECQYSCKYDHGVFQLNRVN